MVLVVLVLALAVVGAVVIGGLWLADERASRRRRRSPQVLFGEDNTPLGHRRLPF